MEYLGEEGKPAPNDKQRVAIILRYLRAARRDSKTDELVFVIGCSGRKVCITGFLRLLGVLELPEIAKFLVNGNV